MMKRNEQGEVEEFDSRLGSGMVESEAVLEVEPVSHSVSHAEAARSPTPGARSDVEPVDSPSRSEVDPISRGASAASPELRAALKSLCIFRCRTKLEL